MQTKRELFIASMRELIDVPFRHHGRNVHGVDCIGALVYSAQKAGITSYDVTTYGRIQSPKAAEKHFGIVADNILLKDAIPGDILYLRIRRFPTHFAMLDTDNCIIHANQMIGKVVKQPFDKYWKERVYKVYRFRGI